MNIKELSILFNYHKEKEGLKFILDKWQEVKNHKINLIICDTGPQNDSIDLNVIKSYDLKVKVLKIKNYVPYNMSLGKNVMVKECSTDWMLLTDPDRFISNENMSKLFNANLDESICYVFKDYDFDVINDRIIKPNDHPNTFLITKNLYNQVGGYNESFCGNYGHEDSEIRMRMKSLRRLDVDLYHYQLMEPEKLYRNRNSYINTLKLYNKNLPFLKFTGDYNVIHEQ